MEEPLLYQLAMPNIYPYILHLELVSTQAVMFIQPVRHSQISKKHTANYDVHRPGPWPAGAAG